MINNAQVVPPAAVSSLCVKTVAALQDPRSDIFFRKMYRGVPLDEGKWSMIVERYGLEAAVADKDQGLYSYNNSKVQFLGCSNCLVSQLNVTTLVATSTLDTHMTGSEPILLATA